MTCFAVSSCIENSTLDAKTYMSDLLFTFTQSNPHKVALDSSDKVIDIYANIAANNELFSSWLSLMSFSPSNFELIDVSLDDIDCIEEVFLKLASQINGTKKVMVNSHQGWENFHYINGNTISYDGVDIEILDKDEAILELATPVTQIISHSIVASGNSQMRDVSLTTTKTT